MKLVDKIKMISDYFESLGMEVTYSDSLIVSYQDDDGIYRNKETGAIRIEVKYNGCVYNYGEKKWHKDTSYLGIEILSNGLWEIDTTTYDGEVLLVLGYFTEEVAKTILENLVKRKTL